MPAQQIVLIVHYFPPINSSGARRMLAMAKYFTKSGRDVTVVTTTKSPSDGAFTEELPSGVKLLELNWRGTSVATPNTSPAAVPTQTKSRGFKDLVLRWFGQIPDPRLPFALSFALPKLDGELIDALQTADIIVATTPPWPPLLAAVIAKFRFKKPVVLDYRDQFSLCHEMPGGAFAKAMELPIDRFLAKRADALVAISGPMGAYYSNFNSNTAVILNGYDHETIEAAQRKSKWAPRAEGTPLTIRYMGLVSLGRIPRSMLTALSKARRAGTVRPGDVSIEYYGEHALMRDYLGSNHPELLDLFSFHPWVSYERALELAVSADHLLFCENSIPPKQGEEQSAQGIFTTKLFEYLASGRPVLAHISPTTLAGSTILQASPERHFVSDNEQDFLDLFSSERFWSPTEVPTTDFVRRLSRSAQADDYLSVLDAVCDKVSLPDRVLVAAK